MDCHHHLDGLYETEHGAVYRCRQCDWFNVFFGPIILSNSRAGFDQLHALIDSLEPELDPAHHAFGRRYHLHTANHQFGLAFTQAEIDELRELLDGAVAMDELDRLLDDALRPSDDS
ncbi:MAG: DUF6686 family protein [Bacteroidota bacterium]